MWSAPSAVSIEICSSTPCWSEASTVPDAARCAQHSLSEAARMGCGPISMKTRQPESISWVTAAENCTGRRMLCHQYAASNVSPLANPPVTVEAIGITPVWGSRPCNAVRNSGSTGSMWAL